MTQANYKSDIFKIFQHITTMKNYLILKLHYLLDMYKIY